MDKLNLPKALRFFGRFAAETEEQARLRRCKEREAAADRIEQLEAELDAARAAVPAQAEHSAGVGKRVLPSRDELDRLWAETGDLPVGDAERLRAFAVAAIFQATAPGDGEHSGRVAALEEAARIAENIDVETMTWCGQNVDDGSKTKLNIIAAIRAAAHKAQQEQGHADQA